MHDLIGPRDCSREREPITGDRAAITTSSACSCAHISLLSLPGQEANVRYVSKIANHSRRILENPPAYHKRAHWAVEHPASREGNSHMCPPTAENETCKERPLCTHMPFLLVHDAEERGRLCGCDPTVPRERGESETRRGPKAVGVLANRKGERMLQLCAHVVSQSRFSLYALEASTECPPNYIQEKLRFTEFYMSGKRRAGPRILSLSRVFAPNSLAYYQHLRSTLFKYFFERINTRAGACHRRARSPTVVHTERIHRPTTMLSYTGSQTNR